MGGDVAGGVVVAALGIATYLVVAHVLRLHAGVAILAASTVAFIAGALLIRGRR